MSESQSKYSDFLTSNKLFMKLNNSFLSGINRKRDATLKLTAHLRLTVDLGSVATTRNRRVTDS